MQHGYQKTKHDSLFPVVNERGAEAPVQLVCPEPTAASAIFSSIVAFGISAAMLFAGNTADATKQAVPSISANEAVSTDLANVTILAHAPPSLERGTIEVVTNRAESKPNAPATPQFEKMIDTSIIATVTPAKIPDARSLPRYPSLLLRELNAMMSSNFNAYEAAVAVDEAALGAGTCTLSYDPRTKMKVAVTFTNSGHVTKSLVESGAFKSTVRGNCIARALGAASVKPFEGSPVTIHRMIRIR